MGVAGLGLSTSVWIWPLAALAAAGVLASVTLLRDHLRLERHAAKLAADLERLESENRRRVPQGVPSGARLERPHVPEAHEPRDAAGRDAWPETDLRRSARTAVSGMMGLTSLLLDTPLDRDQGILVERVRTLGSQVLACLDGGTCAPPPAREPEDRKAKRVLLVEDNEVNALLALKSLERAGAVVEWVRGGKDAVAAARESFQGDAPAYDLVLMDLRMPEIDGFEAARRIRSIEEALRRPPLRIVALTATTMRQDRMAAHAAGIDEFLSKPYRADVLAGLLAPAAERLLATS